ncbi:hypothetical protein JOM56_002997, partial [Amanita muscaria]
IAVVPLFAGIRQFPQGRGFKQWTGADSKALMKVYLAAVEGLIPKDMVKALHAFLEFCYTARRDILDTQSLQSLWHSLTEFHTLRTIFLKTGVRQNKRQPYPPPASASRSSPVQLIGQNPANCNPNWLARFTQITLTGLD